MSNHDGIQGPKASAEEAARAAWEAQRAGFPASFEPGVAPAPAVEAPPPEAAGWTMPSAPMAPPTAPPTSRALADGQGMWIAAIVAVVLVVGLVVVVVTSHKDAPPPKITDNKSIFTSDPADTTTTLSTRPLVPVKAVPEGYKTITADDLAAVSVPESWEAGGEGSSAITDMRILLDHSPVYSDILDHIETTPDIYGKLFGFHKARGASGLLMADAEDPSTEPPSASEVKAQLRSSLEGAGSVVKELSAYKVRLNGRVAMKSHVVLAVGAFTESFDTYTVTTSAHDYNLSIVTSPANPALADKVAATYVVR